MPYKRNKTSSIREHRRHYRFLENKHEFLEHLTKLTFNTKTLHAFAKSLSAISLNMLRELPYKTLAEITKDFSPEVLHHEHNSELKETLGETEKKAAEAEKALELIFTHKFDRSTGEDFDDWVLKYRHKISKLADQLKNLEKIISVMQSIVSNQNSDSLTNIDRDHLEDYMSQMILLKDRLSTTCDKLEENLEMIYSLEDATQNLNVTFSDTETDAILTDAKDRSITTPICYVRDLILYNSIMIEQSKHSLSVCKKDSNTPDNLRNFFSALERFAKKFENTTSEELKKILHLSLDYDISRIDEDLFNQFIVVVNDFIQSEEVSKLFPGIKPLANGSSLSDISAFCVSLSHSVQDLLTELNPDSKLNQHFCGLKEDTVGDLIQNSSEYLPKKATISGSNFKFPKHSFSNKNDVITKTKNTLTGTTRGAFNRATEHGRKISQAQAPIHGSGKLSQAQAPVYGSGKLSQAQAPVHGSGNLSQAQAPIHGSGKLSQAQAPVYGSGKLSQAQAPVYGSGKLSQAQAPIHGSGNLSQAQAPIHGSGKLSQAQAPVYGSGKLSQAQAPIHGSGKLSQAQAPIHGSGKLSQAQAPIHGSGKKQKQKNTLGSTYPPKKVKNTDQKKASASGSSLNSPRQLNDDSTVITKQPKSILSTVITKQPKSILQKTGLGAVEERRTENRNSISR